MIISNETVARIQTVLSGSFEPVLIVNQALHIEYANPFALELLESRSTGITGRSVREFVRISDEEFSSVFCHPDVEFGSFDTSIHSAENRILPVLLNICRLPANDEKSSFIYFYFIRDMRETLRREVEQIHSEKVNILKDFVTSIRQRVAGPISSLSLISGYLLEEMEKGISDPHLFRSSLLEFQDNINRIKLIIEKLSFFSNNNSSMTWYPININDIITQIHSIYSTLFLDSGVEFVLALDSNLPYLICMPGRIEQALIHLINYIKSSFDSNQNPVYQLEIRSLLKNGMVTIEIENNSVPFHKTFLSILHSQETLISESDRKIFTGVASFKRIIEEHGGEISVKSEFMKGNLITIAFPAKEMEF